MSAVSPGKRRRPYPKRRQRPKTPFSAKLSAAWLSEHPWASASHDEQTLKLRAGIAEFRARVVVGAEKPT